ncbi:Niemann-Pick type C-related protein 1 [Diplonema papillatum]|nr:Niemann-Pick type C-related protein 1 [Diplonema papillatum]
MHPTLPDVEKPSSPPRAVDEGVTHDRGGPQDETAKAAPKVQLLSRVSGMMHAGLELAFTKLTTVVVNHPVITIIISVLVALTLAQGVWLYEEELSPDKSYTPRDSQAVVEQEWVERVFGNEKRRLEIYVTSTGDNMLTRESLTFMFEYQQAIENELSTIVEGVVVNYNTICGRHEKDGPCQKPDSVLSLWGNNITTFEEDADFMATINSDTAWRQVKPTGPGARHYLGGVATTNQTVVTGAKVARLVYRLRNEKQKISGKEDNDLQSYKFELALVEYSRGTVASEGKSLGIEVHVIAESDIDETSNEAMSSDVTSLIIGYMMMLVYASFVLFRGRLKSSHAFLGMFSVLCVGASTISAYGFMWFIGVKFNAVVQALILLLLGVGVDDTFVIMDSWWDCGHVPDLKQRMIVALSHAGPAITVTSLTDIIAFLAGSSTSLPALQDFCYYAAAGVTFDFVFQITLFVAVAFLDTLRQAKSRMDVFCCVTVTEDTGVWIDGPPCVSKAVGHRGIMHHVVGVMLPRAIVGSKVGRGLVILAAVIILVFGIWGCTEVRMNFDIEWFVPDGSDILDSFDIRDTYFGGRSLPSDVYFSGMDFSTEESQTSLKNAVSIVSGDRFVQTGSVSSFLDVFISYLENEHPTWTDPNTGLNVSSTYTMLGEVFVTSAIFFDALKVFTSPATAPLYAFDYMQQVRWNEQVDSLVSVRIGLMIITEALEDGEVAVDAMDSLRDTCTRIRVPAGARQPFPWSFAFVFFEGFKVIVTEITRNVLIAGLCVLLLVTVLLANIFMGLIVAVIIGAIDTCMLGYMPWLGVELNSVSVICIMIAIGIAVDYSVHIAHAFLLVSASDQEFASSRAQRAAYALWKMGPAVFNGGFSTFLAILPLALAKSYVFTVFFRMFSVIIVSGQFFGVLVLPMFLSLVGPPPNADAINLDESSWLNPLSPDFDHTPIGKGLDNTGPAVQAES